VTKRRIRFGIIGLGLMGREFASAVGRWAHLTNSTAQPEIIAVCDTNSALFPWYTDSIPSICQVTEDYRKLLENPDVEAVYCAIPHSLHEQVYTDILKSGKHLLGEKPFGIDLAANEAINAEIAKHPDLIVRCASEFPYYPAVSKIMAEVAKGGLGDILQVEAGFLHSSDINPDKVINWKRMIAVNGEYGCMGDLGMHVLHVPFRLGFKPLNVFAQLQNIVQERPNADGEIVPCETWDNATLHCDVEGERGSFPMTLKTWRIAPGETNTWYFKILGSRRSFSFNTKEPRTLYSMNYTPGEPQEWRREDLGYTPVFPSITGGIFEFGFTDSILQMWAAYIEELSGVDVGQYGCVRPEEVADSHKLFTAALESQKSRQVVSIDW
jgi:predicted dehydrogenase